MSRSPSTWAEVEELMVQLLDDRPAVREWIREALEQRYGVQDPSELPRTARAVAFQKTLGVLYALEDEPGDLAFLRGIRQVVAAAFAKYMGGIVLDGPPWRLDPYEDLPTYQEWRQQASFDEEVA